MLGTAVKVCGNYCLLPSPDIELCIYCCPLPGFSWKFVLITFLCGELSWKFVSFCPLSDAVRKVRINYPTSGAVVKFILLLVFVGTFMSYLFVLCWKLSWNCVSVTGLWRTLSWKFINSYHPIFRWRCLREFLEGIQFSIVFEQNYINQKYRSVFCRQENIIFEKNLRKWKQS